MNEKLIKKDTTHMEIEAFTILGVCAGTRLFHLPVTVSRIDSISSP